MLQLYDIVIGALIETLVKLTFSDFFLLKQNTSFFFIILVSHIQLTLSIFIYFDVAKSIKCSNNKRYAIRIPNGLRICLLRWNKKKKAKAKTKTKTKQNKTKNMFFLYGK